MPRVATGRCLPAGWLMSRLGEESPVRCLMTALPPESTPLNQHSLRALEAWLQQLGAIRMDDNPCQWMLDRSEWRALLLLEREDLKVIWHPGSLEAMVQCSLPYGLSRADVEAAIQAGP